MKRIRQTLGLLFALLITLSLSVVPASAKPKQIEDYKKEPSISENAFGDIKFDVVGKTITEKDTQEVEKQTELKQNIMIIIVVVLILKMVFGLIIYRISQSKGFQSPIGWFLLGFLVPIIALICVLVKSSE